MGLIPSMPRKMNLDIVHAQTVIEQDGNKLVIMVFWAVYNPSSPITLLSMFQLGEGHCKIDPIPKTHKGINGQKGTQGIQFPYSTFHWQFDLDGCMLTLPHCLPMEKEKQSKEYVEITPRARWNPHQYDSYHDDLVPVTITSQVHLHQQMC